MRWFTKIGTTTLLAACATFGAAASAQALILGDTALPKGSTLGPVCGAGGTYAEIVQTATDASYRYTVPAGGGTITSWSVNTSGATAGSPYELLIARPSGANYQIVGTATERLPAPPLPAVATFTHAKPIAVHAGDVLGVVVSPHGMNTVHCRFLSSPLTSSDIVGNGFEGTGASSPSVGGSFAALNATPNELVNVSATLVQSSDVGITMKVEPASTPAGSDAAFVLSITNSGSSQTPVTVTDTIPSGLTIQSVSAGTAPCSIIGQTVSCRLSGTPANVAIVVSAPKPGVYKNRATATGTLTDSNSANNSCTGTLTVTGPTTVSWTLSPTHGSGTFVENAWGSAFEPLVTTALTAFTAPSPQQAI
jgi:uncharacterized repeat protein (TIGR01451 family)